MLILKKIAVTGPLSSGKSTVCQILAEISKIYVVDADQLVHELYSDPEIKEKVAEIYNKKLNPEKPITPLDINKQFIAEYIFDHPKQLHKLEKVLHPFVKEKIEEHYQKAKKTLQCDLFVVEVPLLYEVGWEKEIDSVILVNADEETCKKRFTKKTGKSEEEYRKRNERFLPIHEKMKKKPFLVDNLGSLDSIKNQLKTIIAKIQLSGD